MTMENIFRGIGEDWLSESAFSPAQRFRQYAQQTTAPGSALRNAFYGLQSPLTQQYYLGGMGGTPRFGTSGAYGGGFGDFLRNYTGEVPGATYPGGMNLRDLATQIAKISQMPEVSYTPPGAEPGDPAGFSFSDFAGTLPQAGAANPGDLTREQANLFRQIYTTEADSEENRRQLANLLALQRPGGAGVYGGVVGRALSGSVNELYNQYMSQNPMGNFLQYYLGRTKPSAPVGNADIG